MQLAHRAAFGSLLSLTVACATTHANDDVDQDVAYQHADGGVPDAAPDTAVDAAPDAPDEASTFVDPRDGQTYRTVRFGAAIWFAENLRYAVDGASFCYGDDEASCERDGRLYLFSAALEACPPGSHLGSDAEWKALEAAAGMKPDQLDLSGYATPRGSDEGATLKKADGFAARMAGYRAGSSYDARDDRTYFWTSSTQGGDVWRRRIAASESTVYRFTNPPSTFAISVRCVAD